MTSAPIPYAAWVAANPDPVGILFAVDPHDGPTFDTLGCVGDYYFEHERPARVAVLRHRQPWPRAEIRGWIEDMLDLFEERLNEGLDCHEDDEPFKISPTLRKRIATSGLGTEINAYITARYEEAETIEMDDAAWASVMAGEVEG